MAIDNQFGKGIGVAAGFDLGAQKPLDARIAVNTIAERDAHVENNRAYEGMVVFVDETKKSYQLINGVWVELLKAEQDRLDALEAMLNGGEGAEGANGVLGALQDNIDAVQDNLDKAKTDLQKEIDDDVAAEAALRTAEEAKIREEIAQALADAKAHAEAKDLADRTAQSEFDTAQNNRITALENANKEGGSVANAIKAVQDDLDNFKGTQETAHQGLVQKDGELDQAIKDEAAKAREEEGKLQSAIDAINNSENGILAQAKALDKTDRGAQLLVDQEQDRRLGLLEAANAKGGAVAEAIAEAKNTADAAQADADELEKRLDDEGGLVDRLESVEQFAKDHDDTKRDQKIADNKAAIDKLNGTAEEVGSVAKAVKDAVDAEATNRENADSDLSNRIAVFEAGGAQDVAAKELRLAAAEEDIARLDGTVDVEGSVKKQIKDAIDAVNGAAETLAGRVKANEDKLTGLTNATVKAEIEAAQAAAEKHADDAITALVDSAPDAMNTLNELAKAINNNKGIYDAYIEEHNTAMNNLKSDLQKEIDADVKVVADELAKQKDDAQEGTLANKIKAEATRADAAEKANKAAIDELIETVGHDVIKGEIGETIETASGLVARIIANETFVAAQPAIDTEQDRRLTELEAFKNAMGAESVGLDKRIDALELFVNGKEAEEGVAAVRSVDQKIADAEAAAKNHAEAQDTALHATIKAEMAAVIQSLQASITEDGMLRIALGGIEGDNVLVIREQKIPFVTDDEIDAIIAGLDTVEGE